MNSEKYIIIITTTDNKKIASSIAGMLIKAGLAACVQIERIDSFFFWRGQLEEIKEFRLLIKTRDSHYAEVEKSIISHHNYDLPQIIKLNITDGLPAYLEWIHQETSRDKA